MEEYEVLKMSKAIIDAEYMVGEAFDELIEALSKTHKMFWALVNVVGTAIETLEQATEDDLEEEDKEEEQADD